MNDKKEYYRCLHPGCPYLSRELFCMLHLAAEVTRTWFRA